MIVNMSDLRRWTREARRTNTRTEGRMVHIQGEGDLYYPIDKHKGVIEMLDRKRKLTAHLYWWQGRYWDFITTIERPLPSKV